MNTAEIVLKVKPGQYGEKTTDDWREGVRVFARGLDILTSRTDIAGEILKFEFAGARLLAVASSAQMMRRLRPSRGDAFKPLAIVQISGSMRVKQCGRQCELSPGSFTFIDGSLPHELEYDGDFQDLVLEFPKTAFSLSVYRKAVATGLDPLDPLNLCFSEGVRNIWKAAVDMHPLQHAAALGALISLCQLTTPMSSALSDRDTPIRVLRAMSFIEQNLSNPDLCPQMVADSQGVSRRYLDALFVTKGHRLQTWIWERRLQRAADDLRMSSATSKTILQAALANGFKTPSHFSRAFAKRFGVPPREFKRQNGIKKLDA